MYFSFNYWLYLLPAILLTFLASQYVKRAYAKWSRVATRSGVTGAEAARRLMTYAGVPNIRIEVIPGNLTDHYDPRNKVLRLSHNVAQTPTVASVAIAAHELGHAQQDANNYLLLRVHNAIVPAVNFGTQISWILIMAGLFLNLTGLAWAGVMLFSLSVLFALITLPLELNASARARRLLRESGIIQTEQEAKGVNQVLNAAALTYVAMLFTATMQLLYYVSLVSGRRRR